jgi:hypothetical protein
MENGDAKRLSDKLDVLIALVAAQIGAELSLADRVPLLNRLGLDRNQIARVCGTSPEVVSVRLAEAKRRGHKRQAHRRSPRISE